MAQGGHTEGIASGTLDQNGLDGRFRAAHAESPSADQAASEGAIKQQDGERKVLSIAIRFLLVGDTACACRLLGLSLNWISCRQACLASVGDNVAYSCWTACHGFRHFGQSAPGCSIPVSDCYL